ncbi:MAG TPA: PAS domain-containing protein [bacterium]|nr:PAS domain-containing protein [bacterium]
MTRARPSAGAEHASLDARASAQRVADVLAAALHVGVEIVDRDFVRLAASETTALRRLGPPTPALYLTAMRTRLPAWADEAGPRDGPIAAFPIVAAGDAVGAIGLQSVLTEQGTALRAQRRKVADLVAAMAEPLRGAAGWRAAAPTGGRPDGTLSAVLEALPDGVLATDGAGVVLYCNRAALQMLRAEMDLTGQILAHVYPPAAEHGRPSAAPQTREVDFDRHGHRFRFLETRGPLRMGNGALGTFFALRAGAGASSVQSSLPTLEEAERQLIEEALARHGTTGTGKRRAARALGISLSTLYRKLPKPPARRRTR